MAIALATLETNIYTTLFNFFTSGTYSLITSGTINNSGQVTPVYSDTISSKYGFPVIELGDAEIVNISTNRFGDVQKADISVPILVVEDNASDGRTTADELKSFLLTGYGVLKLDGLHKVGSGYLSDAGNTIISKNVKHYHYKRFNVNFTYRERLA